MKFIFNSLFVFSFLFYSCSTDIYEQYSPKEEIDHQKEYLNFFPVVWKTHVIDSMIGQSGILSEPIVYKDLVIVNKHKFGLVAVNRHTGETIWTKEREQIGEQPSFVSWDSYGMAIIDDILLCFPTNDSFGINPETGETLWHREYPLISGTRLRVIYKNSFYKISKNSSNIPSLTQTDISTGHSEIIYSWPSDHEVEMQGLSVVYEQDGQRFITLTWDNTIHSINLDTKEMVWSHTYISEGCSYNKLFIHNELIIFTNMCTTDPSLTAISVEDGTIHWRHDLNYTHLYFQSQFDNYLLHRPTGREILKLNLDNGESKYFDALGIGLNDLYKKDGMLFSPGFHHFEDSPYSLIGRKIAVVDPRTMKLNMTILPKIDKNTTVHDQECGTPVFDNDYSYIANNMAFSDDKQFIYVTGKSSDLYCLAICDSTLANLKP